jgi:hypothetical protein
MAVEPRAVPRGDAELRIFRSGDRGYRGDNRWGRGRQGSSCRASGEHQARDAQSHRAAKVATCFPYFHHHTQSAGNYRRPGVGRRRGSAGAMDLSPTPWSLPGLANGQSSCHAEMTNPAMGMPMVISEKGTDRLSAKRRNQKRGRCLPYLIGIYTQQSQDPRESS